MTAFVSQDGDVRSIGNRPVNGLTSGLTDGVDLVSRLSCDGRNEDWGDREERQPSGFQLSSDFLFTASLRALAASVALAETLAPVEVAASIAPASV